MELIYKSISAISVCEAESIPDFIMVGPHKRRHAFYFQSLQTARNEATRERFVGFITWAYDELVITRYRKTLFITGWVVNFSDGYFVPFNFNVAEEEFARVRPAVTYSFIGGI